MFNAPYKNELIIIIIIACLISLYSMSPSAKVLIDGHMLCTCARVSIINIYQYTHVH